MCSHPENTRPLELKKIGEGEICVGLAYGNRRGGGFQLPPHKHPVAIRNKIAKKSTKRMKATDVMLVYRRGYIIY